MKAQRTTEKPRFREYPAKPALLRRRDVSLSLFHATMGSLDSSVTPEIAVNLPVPSLDSSVEVFKRDYWIAEMWSKFPFEIDGIDRTAAAMLKFGEAETLCKQANGRLFDGWNRPWTSSIREPLLKARRILHKLLSDITVEEVFHGGGWGPGVSTSLKKSKCSRQNKWEESSHATASVLPWIQALGRWTNLKERPITVVTGNRITTVPKNAKVDRTIAIEPDWNMFFQKGLGRAIRRRMNRVGLLLKDSQQRNQALARVGSRDNSFGTIDLAGASDSVSLALCELLLPPHIFEIVMSLRSDVGLLPSGQTGRYEKVSSMGNGATFELETALFFAIGSAVAVGGVVCYGDDIIVADHEDGLRVIELLEFCGFKVNVKKTFTMGPFRESCGGHYFNGVDVTPPYFRNPVDSLDRYISAANSLSRRVSWRDAESLRLFGDAWRDLAKGVPQRFRGPRQAGDICLWAPFDATCPDYHTKWLCHVGQGIRIDRIKAGAPEWGMLQSALHGDTHVEEYATPEGVAKVCYWYADRWSYAAPNF